ncbi:DUF262 domain-containing protein [Occultella kanbiaonis]|uniref:DUF262 domain-containing protein n=1 Tax=Occultella kanbiaonis TaxID=2675754 RepID=UPI00143D3C51|nr:DUF262 domain-containing protein [Occultella kanbiaonis]
MYFLGNRVAQPLGPGSKEKKSALVALGTFVGLSLEHEQGKIACGRAIASVVGVSWDETCYSRGDTITLEGMNRLLAGAVRWHIDSGRTPARALVRDLVTLNSAPAWDDYEWDMDMTTDLSEIATNIADSIAELAEAGPAPAGVDTSKVTEISRAAIRLEDASWRTALAAVQDWLHFPDTLDESSAAAFDDSLRASLEPASETGETELLQALQERLDHATGFRRDFVDALNEEQEGGVTLETASAQWESEWLALEEAEEASEVATPINAKAEVWPIFQFRQHAEDRELELSPSYQRADVWPTGDAQLLIESILRGIPLPSVIVLEHNTNEGQKYEIVDGKQRLTAILRFTGSHPKALETVEQKAKEWGTEEAAAIFRTNYPAFKKLWRKHEMTPLTLKVERELYFPFPLRSAGAAVPGILADVAGRYYTDIRHVVIDVVGSKRPIRALFEQATDYKVPIIIYSGTNPRQVHEVFSLYNKQGKHLNAEEIRNAAYHQIALMRALLVTAGDSPNVGTVAPFLEDIWDDLSSTSRNLAAYGFGDAGYKRTKALSWVAATLLMEDPGLEGRSTSAHINSLLKRVQDHAADPLHSEVRVAELMSLLDRAVDLQASVPDEVWAPKFKNSLGRGRWQELQLVATLVAFAGAAVVHRDGARALVEDDDVLQALEDSTRSLRRPTKTQSKEQWQFIADAVRSILAALRTDPLTADVALREQFGSSGLSELASLSSGQG